ncbi:MAG: polysaccharide biosynthesis protein [Thiotrichaceae bacterium]|nr:polysaccharide biosynthesis protein [Thiotrichaceae bacterium]
MYILKQLNKLSRQQKQIFAILTDIACITFSIWAAFVLAYSDFLVFSTQHLPLLFLAVIITIPIFLRFDLYRAVFRHTDGKAYWSIMLASILSIGLYTIVAYTLTSIPIPKAVPFITFLLLVILITSSRVAVKSLFLVQIQKNNLSQTKNIMIYGAGNAGAELSNALLHSGGFNIIGFIDNNKMLHGKIINGKKIYSLEQVCQDFLTTESQSHKKIDEILLALPKNTNKRTAIVNELEKYRVKVRTLPTLLELAQGKVTIESIKELDIEDLLGRDPVLPVKKLIDANIKTYNIMITGAGGSIGSELCRQIIQQKPQLIVLYELSEFALYEIEQELLTLLKTQKIHLPIIPILGSVTNQQRIERVCKTFGIHTIYHAAAYKHVPMVEQNISEGVNNNIFGTYHCAQAAINAKVHTFVLISTDKAVRPTNTMGATKRFAELILQTLSQQKHKTRFTMVRFGNVLGSSGSVIPLFREQIKKGGPLTITHKDIKRYFMTTQEASQLVIQAGAMGKGGDVFVLDMGEPVMITDLAKRMIKLSGAKAYNGSEGIPITYIGLRSGEKISEELLIGKNVTDTLHPRIMRANEESITQEQLTHYLQIFQQGIRNEDEPQLRNTLREVVTGFVPQCEIVDALCPNLENKQVS